MEPLVEAYSRVDRFCRCMLHMFCADVPQGVANTVDTDVTFFLDTDSGKELFERSLKKIFRDPNLWWSQEIAEMKKTKANTILSGDKLNELSDLLASDDPMNVAGIAQAASLFEEVKGSMRSQKLADVRKRFCVP